MLNKYLARYTPGCSHSTKLEIRDTIEHAATNCQQSINVYKLNDLIKLYGLGQKEVEDFINMTRPFSN